MIGFRNVKLHELTKKFAAAGPYRTSVPALSGMKASEDLKILGAMFDDAEPCPIAALSTVRSHGPKSMGSDCCAYSGDLCGCCDGILGLLVLFTRQENPCCVWVLEASFRHSKANMLMEEGEAGRESCKSSCRSRTWASYSPV